AVAEAPGAPLHGTLEIAGKRAPDTVVTAFTDNGDGDAARTDDSGEWAMWDIPSGTYTLEVAGRDNDPYGVVPTPSAAVAMVLPGTAQLTGVVQDAQAAPIAGADVSGRDEKGRSYYTQTDALGHFVLENVLPGTVSVSVRPPHAAAPSAQQVTLT